MGDEILRLNDRMIANDDLVVVNKVRRSQSECAAPHGRLFEILGYRNGHRIVKEIACNTVVVGGAIKALEAITGKEATWKPQTINEKRSIPAPTTNETRLCLFGIGIGSSPSFGTVYEPDVKQDDLRSAIPMRFTATLSDEDRAKYFMKSTAAISQNRYYWWLKEFASDPVIKTCWKNSTNPDKDGTEITSSISSRVGEDTPGVETFAEITINMNIYDGREYFENTGSLETARYNEIGFYTGAKNAAGTEYGDVRLYSAVAFNNKDLTIKTKSSLVYRLYSMI